MLHGVTFKLIHPPLSSTAFINSSTSSCKKFRPSSETAIYSLFAEIIPEPFASNNLKHSLISKKSVSDIYS